MFKTDIYVSMRSHTPCQIQNEHNNNDKIFLYLVVLQKCNILRAQMRVKF